MSIKLQRFFAFSFFLIGILWTLVSIRDYWLGRIFYIVGGIGIFYVLIGSVSFFYRIRTKTLMNLFFLIVVLNYSYILTEFCAYFYLGPSKLFPMAYFFNKPCTEFDKISGYRWKGNSCRFVCMRIGEEVIFDNRFNPNQQGYISRKDYLYKKPNSNTIRYMVFGDSYTAGEYLRMPWPDRIEEIMNSSSNKWNYEFYSFAIEGGGLFNWHEIFFNEIIPNYEFDGIIIASFADNLYRCFSVIYMDKSGGYFGRFTSVPKDKTDFMINYRPRMLKRYDILDDSELDTYIQKYINSPFVFARLSPDLYVLPNTIKLFWRVKSQLREKYLFAAASTYAGIRKKIGNEQFKKLEEMIQWCRTHNKQIYLVTIPALGALKKRNLIWYEFEKELQLVAENFDMPFYSGYKVFDGLSNDEIDQYWLHYDGHWNQQGSDRFAQYLAQYIKQQLQPVRQQAR